MRRRSADDPCPFIASEYAECGIRMRSVVVVFALAPADAGRDEAVEIANGTPFGLNSAVFTNDLQRAYRVARGLRAGTVGHNSFQTDFSVSFGGFKQSGIGREGGTEGLLPYLETKTMILDATPDFSEPLTG